jgi:hypothetical protein
MMLVSLILMDVSVSQNRLLLLLENCERRTHQRETPRFQLRWKYPGNLHARANLPPVDRRRTAHPASKQVAETPEARTANLHAHVGDGVVAQRQQILGSVEARVDTKLVRRLAEHSLELTDEMKRRHHRLARDVPDRHGLVVHLAQHVSRAAQTEECASSHKLCVLPTSYFLLSVLGEDSL